MAFNSADTAAFKDVWVFCEQRQGKMMPTTFELISEGRKLADELGVEAVRHSAGRQRGRHRQGAGRLRRRQGLCLRTAPC